jgi:hypothetical protein
MVRALRCSTLALLVLTALLSACQRSKDKEETRYEAFPATMPAPTPVLTAAEAVPASRFSTRKLRQ